MTDDTLFAALDPDRAVLRVSGPDAEPFLQGLLTNDVSRAASDRAVYAGLLTPQGKFLFDMILTRPEPELFLLDVDRSGRAALAQRLSMYKLRAKVEIAPDDALSVILFWRDAASEESAIEEIEVFGAASNALDPRAPGLGRRVLTGQPDAALATATPGALAGHEKLRLALAVPKAGLDLVSSDTFPLEAGFERVHGVDFRKGCYVGQEVTARMRHKTELKKRLVRLRVENGDPGPGAEVLAGEKPAGRLGSVADGEALAILRVDRLDGGPLTAEGAALTLIE